MPAATDRAGKLIRPVPRTRQLPPIPISASWIALRCMCRGALTGILNFAGRTRWLLTTTDPGSHDHIGAPNAEDCKTDH